MAASPDTGSPAKPQAPGAAPAAKAPGVAVPKAPGAAAPKAVAPKAPGAAAPKPPSLAAPKAPGAAAPKPPSAVAPRAAAPAPSPAPKTPGRGVGASPSVPSAPDSPAPRRRQAVRIAAGVLGLAVLLSAIVLATRWFLGTATGAEFLRRFPGTAPIPQTTPVGFPAWLNWSHFFNVFFIALILRTGLTIRRQRRPAAYWAPRWSPQRKLDLTLWMHLAIDTLWVINGVAYLVLLAWSGHWMRLIPTSWEVLPNAVSAGLQYASLDWPSERAWVNYNGLQQIFYFLTVFVAAPLAIATGARMSEWWPKRWSWLTRAFSLKAASAVHVAVMIYFVVFTLVHTALVLSTGVVGHLNAMFAARDSAMAWQGPAAFVAAMLCIAAAIWAARAFLVAPLARLLGPVTAR